MVEDADRQIDVQKRSRNRESFASEITPSLFIEDLSHLSESRSQTAVPALSEESSMFLPTLQRLVNDCFSFIHPLIPIPHEPSFRAAFIQRENITDQRFLALLVAMVGTLVASFPRWLRMPNVCLFRLSGENSASSTLSAGLELRRIKQLHEFKNNHYMHQSDICLPEQESKVPPPQQCSATRSEVHNPIMNDATK
jgi:hypothetical protein